MQLNLTGNAPVEIKVTGDNSNLSKYQNTLVEKVGILASKCMELSLITGVNVNFEYSHGFDVWVHQEVNGKRVCIHPVLISWSIDEESALKEIAEFEQQLEKAIEEETLPIEWDIKLAEAYHEDYYITQKELAKLFNLEQSDIAHLYPQQEEPQEVSPSRMLPTEQAMKYSGMSMKDFI